MINGDGYMAGSEGGGSASGVVYLKSSLLLLCVTLLAIDKESELSKGSGTDVFLSDHLFQ